MVRGLNLPWDVKPIPGGRLLITERSTKRLLLWYRGHLQRVRFPASTVWASGETGLMGLAVDPAFTRNHRFYTCQGSPTSTGGHDVRVLAWRFRTRPMRAVLIRRLLIGIPSTSGRHAGCRLLIAANGSMIVGTGDAATGTNPRNLSSLGGKTLRLSRLTGRPWKNNPYIGSSIGRRRYVMTFGHRNVQGLAQRADGTLWSAEHGPDRDDEVNRLRVGGDYGWNPVPGYDESVPMTDQSLPGTQVEARWSSGFPTLATSGIAWVRGNKWQAYRGTLAVAALKGSRLMFMRFDANGVFRGMRTPTVLRHFGRLRSVTNLPNGDLLVTTSNDNGHDAVLRVRPQS
jgi:glucose/arabinose dehydrogenase